jgi:hypothetical protein
MKENHQATNHTMLVSPTPAKSSLDAYMDLLWQHTLSVCNSGRKQMLVKPIHASLSKIYLAECEKRNKRFLPAHALRKTFRNQGVKVNKNAIVDSGINSEGLMKAFSIALYAFRAESNKSQSTALLINKMAGVFNINTGELTS